MVRKKNSEAGPPKKRQSSKAESRSNIQLTGTKNEGRGMIANAKKFHKVKRRILTTLVTSLMLKNRIDELVEQASEEITLTEDAGTSESRSKEMDQSLGEISSGNQRKDSPDDS